ncbi:putative bifunctional diguanylate cyclase/phosphodiesterase, partial [Thalassiella azotivora]
ALWAGRVPGARADEDVAGPPPGVPLLVATGSGSSVLATTVLLGGGLTGVDGAGPAASALWLAGAAALAAGPWWGPLLVGSRRATASTISRATVAACAAAAVVVGVLGPWSADGWLVAVCAVALLAVTGVLAVLMAENRRLSRRVAAVGVAPVRDPVTGLPARAALEAELEDAVERRQAGGPPVALLSCVIGGLADVHDTAGRGVGEDVLRQAARGMLDAVGQHGLLVRSGDVEFALLVQGDTGADRLDALARALLGSLDRSYAGGGGVHHLVACVGLAHHEPGGGAEDVLRHADVARHGAEAAGWGSVQVYVPQLRDRVVSRVRARSRLRSAVGEATPEVRFQPQVRLADGEVVGVEALVGWRSPDGKRLATDAVIELAEGSGAIVDLGARVLGAAARHAARWRADGHDLRVSVNLSVRQLGWPGTVDAVDSALARSGLPATALTLEVTESLLLPDSPGAIEALELIRSTGVRLAVDDFGTGWSGLDHLRRLTVDELKIDKRFMQHAGSRARETALLAAIVRLGRDLGLDVVAEGVEDVGQARLLRDAGCHLGQGYAFSKPLVASAVEAFLERGAFDLDAPLPPHPAGEPVPVPRVERRRRGLRDRRAAPRADAVERRSVDGDLSAS